MALSSFYLFKGVIMDTLITKGFVEKALDEEGVLEVAIASDGVIDREGDAVSPDGWDLSNFLKNPQFLWGHNIREYRAPIGKVEKIWFEGDGPTKKLMFRPKFDLKDEFASEIYRKYKEGFLNAFSVGFIPLEKQGKTFTKAELLEISAVSVPANPNAIVMVRGKALKNMDWNEVADMQVESKKVVPFKAWGTLPDSSSWNASEVKKRLKDWSDGKFKKYKQGFAWFNDEDSEKVSSYKLAHHDVRGDSLVTNWRGVASAMASLLGARGGAKIPDEDKRKVYNHLKKHYAEFDKPVPEYRYVEEQVLKKLDFEYESIIEQEFMGFVKHTLRSINKKLKK